MNYCVREWLDSSPFGQFNVYKDWNFNNFKLRKSRGIGREQMADLKGLSHEIDLKNVDENGQILALLRAAAGFWIFWRLLWFLVEIKHLCSGKC